MSPYRTPAVIPTPRRFLPTRMWSRPAAVLLLHIAVAHSGRCCALAGSARATLVWLHSY